MIMKNQLLILLCFFYVAAIGQTTVLDFEEANLASNDYINGITQDTSLFNFQDVQFSNYYDIDFDYWASGWAVSTVQDSTTNDYSNLYGAYPFGGANNSETYLVGQYTSFVTFPNNVPVNIQSVDITNATFPLLIMRDGDPNGFSKQFGGDDGNDPDFFILTIKGFNTQGQLIDSINFHLADYTFEDNTQDYIINKWTTVDLSTLGEVHSLSFSLSSSDFNQFGILTPAFYCIDNLAFETTNSLTEHNEVNISIYPNPTTDQINIKLDQIDPNTVVRLLDLNGKILIQNKTSTSHISWAVNHLKQGIYFVEIVQNGNRIVKQISIK